MLLLLRFDEPEVGAVLIARANASFDVVFDTGWMCGPEDDERAGVKL
jgi:hypothetical protein